MLPKKVGKDVVLACGSCGYIEKTGKVEGYKVVKKVGARGDVTVLDEKPKSVLPTTRARCPSCGHDTAFWWIRQTRAGDEPSTRFYRCVKCGKVWREYS